eukprot:CAMPEP_0179120888 /NCGR_PEP_ID=MMETSP0796-20121207/56983_1 /TAXON_ID=73915 /ORGANISM="Pyrodinium bahamense, Strain pbaha01" /LENGTH=231 /DNA_ID=CAMNT_0020819455 /DNA_START=91 /DNA_END=786 /DNA_ORIENTATION=-
MGAGASIGLAAAIRPATVEELQSVLAGVSKDARDKLAAALACTQPGQQHAQPDPYRTLVVRYLSGEVVAQITPIPATVAEIKQAIHATQGTDPLLQQLVHSTQGLLDDQTLLDTSNSAEVILFLDETAATIAKLERCVRDMDAAISAFQVNKAVEPLMSAYKSFVAQTMEVKSTVTANASLKAKLKAYFEAARWDARLNTLGEALQQLQREGTVPKFDDMVRAESSKRATG